VWKRAEAGAGAVKGGEGGRGERKGTAEVKVAGVRQSQVKNKKIVDDVPLGHRFAVHFPRHRLRA